MSFHLICAFTSPRKLPILLSHLREQYTAALLPLYQRSSGTWIFAMNYMFLLYFKDAQVAARYRKHNLEMGILLESFFSPH